MVRNAFGAGPTLSPIATNTQVTTKIPPGDDGTTLWFTCEKEVDEWRDITELEAARRGPALRNRLSGEAASYKAMLEIEAQGPC